jgi:hypothetical protein
MAVSSEVHLITIHGTWARGRWRNRTVADLAKRKKPPWCFTSSELELPWFCAGSKFLKTLQGELLSRGLTSTVEAFEWSGANSIVDRQTGGEKLAERLTSRPLENSRVVLVTHSHGGSVALAALGRSDVPATIAVAMATPFIRLQDQRKGQDRRHALEKVLASFGLVLTPVFFFYVLHRARLSMGVDVPSAIENLIFGVLPVLAFVTCVAALFIPRGVYKHMKSSLDSKSGELPPRHRLLVLRGFDDEAAHVIALGGITSFAARAFTAGLVGLMFFGIFVVGGGIGLLANVSGSSALNRVFVFLLKLWPIGLLILICAALPYRLARVAFGKEFLWLGSDVATTVNSCPDNSGNVTTVTLPNSDRKRLCDLNHGLYDHKNAAAEVAKWISHSH